MEVYMLNYAEFSTARPCLQSNLYAFRSHSLFNKKLVYGIDKRLPCSWRPFRDVTEKSKRFNSSRIEVWRAGLNIKAVATLERAQTIQTNEGNEYRNLRSGIDLTKSTSDTTEDQTIIEDSGEVGHREKLRRERISKANKGNTPWNKGRKHTPETLRRIKERTRLAMQDPKVKMKLANMGHSQTEETRTKIGLGVRMGWEKRREKLMLQETCYYEWQNLLAEASRKGLFGEDELQWSSYQILSEHLEQEWLMSVEQRRQRSQSRPKGSKRAPKSLEQRRKIAEAISAKWADPDYRTRVCFGLAKYHGNADGVERRPRRKPSVNGEIRKRSPRKKIDDVDEFIIKVETKRVKLKKSKVPRFKDPLASSKLEMLKNIRAQRVAPESKESEAITRAKELIAEAEKAAKALEAAAEQSPIAMASLIETRKLIAEATLSLESIQSSQLDLNGTHVKVNGNLERDVVNGTSYKFLESSYDRVKGEENLSLDLGNYDFTRKQPNGIEQSKHNLLLNGAKSEAPKAVTMTKKWVCGRLVETDE